MNLGLRNTHISSDAVPAISTRPEVEPVERARDPPVWCEHEHRRRMSELIVFRIIGGAIAERDGDPFERGLAGDQESGGIRKGSILSDLRRLHGVRFGRAVFHVEPDYYQLVIRPWSEVRPNQRTRHERQHRATESPACIVGEDENRREAKVPDLRFGQ